MKTETYNREIIARNLRRLLKIRGMTAAELAVKSGLTKQYISQLVMRNMKDVRAFRTLQVIAEALEVPVTEIIKR